MTRRPLSDEARRSAAAWMNDAYEVVQGSGAHADHTQQQIGRCVYCSCGERVQGQLPDGAQSQSFAYEVRLADGFVCYKGSHERALEIHCAHPGSTIERVRTSA